MAFTLPELPYAYDALEPSIDAETMQIDRRLARPLHRVAVHECSRSAGV